MLETVFAVNNLVETVKQYCEWNKTTELSIACKVISVCLQFTPACLLIYHLEICALSLWITKIPWMIVFVYALKLNTNHSGHLVLSFLFVYNVLPWRSGPFILSESQRMQSLAKKLKLASAFGFILTSLVLFFHSWLSWSSYLDRH